MYLRYFAFYFLLFLLFIFSNYSEAKSIEANFVLIQAGTFMMGSPENQIGHQSDEVLHGVTITRDFTIQTTEVIQSDWVTVMGANPSFFKGDNLPVETLSWWSAITYANEESKLAGLTQCYDFSQLECDGTAKNGTLKCEGTLRINSNSGLIYDCEGYRLPTEAEWEFSARGGSTTAFSFGDDVSELDNYGWFLNNAGMKTNLVAKKNTNPFGIYDMHGNVWEWVQDWYDFYPQNSVTDPVASPVGANKVSRGGYWGNDAGILRSSKRISFDPNIRSSGIGFRLVKTNK